MTITDGKITHVIYKYVEKQYVPGVSLNQFQGTESYTELDVFYGTFESFEGELFNPSDFDDSVN